MTELNSKSSKKKQTKIVEFEATPTHVDTQYHIYDSRMLIHLTVTNLLWHISHKAARPLERKLLQLFTLMTVNHVVYS